ncbi:MAG: beta-lactamase family protein [Bryobacterales bacterium]|nr:beta-lactamase family protein [Bryobacterales bacterium]
MAVGPIPTQRAGASRGTRVRPFETGLLRIAGLFACAGWVWGAAFELIPARMKESVERGEAVGYVTLVQHRGKVAHLSAVGMQDREKSLPMKTGTIFQVMSMSKPVTSVGIMMLMEEGRLALTDAVEKHLPEFRGQKMLAGDVLRKPARAIAIRDLLTHTSGLQEMPPEGMGGANFYFEMKHTLAEAVAIYSQLPLLFDPGTKWQYSNTGMAALGRIIEVVSGKPYETFLQERVFGPLGMKDSFFFPKEEHKARIAMAYDAGPDGKARRMGDAIYRMQRKYSMPEGGLFSTAVDMAAFYQMMLDGGVYRGKRLLSRASVEAMTAWHTEEMRRHWGLGWSLMRTAGSMLSLTSEKAYGHAGALGTFGWVDPARQLVGVFLVQAFGLPVDGARNTFVEVANASVVE